MKRIVLLVGILLTLFGVYNVRAESIPDPFFDINYTNKSFYMDNQTMDGMFPRQMFSAYGDFFMIGCSEVIEESFSKGTTKKVIDPMPLKSENDSNCTIFKLNGNNKQVKKLTINSKIEIINDVQSYSSMQTMFTSFIRNKGEYIKNNYLFVTDHESIYKIDINTMNIVDQVNLFKKHNAYIEYIIGNSNVDEMLVWLEFNDDFGLYKINTNDLNRIEKVRLEDNYYEEVEDIYVWYKGFFDHVNKQYENEERIIEDEYRILGDYIISLPYDYYYENYTEDINIYDKNGNKVGSINNFKKINYIDAIYIFDNEKIGIITNTNPKRNGIVYSNGVRTTSKNSPLLNAVPTANSPFSSELLFLYDFNGTLLKRYFLEDYVGNNKADVIMPLSFNDNMLYIKSYEMPELNLEQNSFSNNFSLNYTETTFKLKNDTLSDMVVGQVKGVEEIEKNPDTGVRSITGLTIISVMLLIVIITIAKKKDKFSKI